jgi:hypothetical protein
MMLHVSQESPVKTLVVVSAVVPVHQVTRGMALERDVSEPYPAVGIIPASLGSSVKIPDWDSAVDHVQRDIQEMEPDLDAVESPVMTGLASRVLIV